ncbi:MAG TPA: hypothetical protein VMG82_28940 [Candidatus Sulfotelmatobacter sp.]|nr:hypothetical protein [Candidatus Sulfotelmatobacter sp.]
MSYATGAVALARFTVNMRALADLLTPYPNRSNHSVTLACWVDSGAQFCEALRGVAEDTLENVLGTMPVMASVSERELPDTQK